MYLISSNPSNFDIDFTKTIESANDPITAAVIAKKCAAKYGRGYIFKLEKFLVPTGELPVQAYNINDKGEVIPCD